MTTRRPTYLVTFDVVFDSALTIGLHCGRIVVQLAPRSARSRVIALMLELSPSSVYFAAQVPVAPVPPPAAAVDGRGEELYSGGDPARGVPPCQGCHGARALGGPVESGSQYLAYPLLRGQHAAYLVSRLTNFRDKPANGSSNDFIMHGVALTLDDGSIQSLAAWLGSLPPVTAK